MNGGGKPTSRPQIVCDAHNSIALRDSFSHRIFPRIHLGGAPWHIVESYQHKMSIFRALAMQNNAPLSIPGVHGNKAEQRRFISRFNRFKLYSIHLPQRACSHLIHYQSSMVSSWQRCHPTVQSLEVQTYTMGQLYSAYQEPLEYRTAHAWLPAT